LNLKDIRNTRIGAIKDSWRIMRRLRARRYDIMVLLQPVRFLSTLLRMALFSYTVNAKKVVGRSKKGRAFFLHMAVPEDGKHEVERNLEIAKLLGAEVKVSQPKINISQQDKLQAQRFLKEKGVREEDILIGVHPGAYRPSRQWPKERFAGLIDVLQNYPARIVITGSAKEKSMIADIVKRQKREVILSVDREVGELAALIDMFDIFITNDTGPMHLAMTLAPFVVAIFGPGEIKRIGPYGDKERFRIVKKKVPCSPCYKYSCTRHVCMKAIKIGDVFRAVNEGIRLTYWRRRRRWLNLA